MDLVGNFVEREGEDGMGKSQVGNRAENATCSVGWSPDCCKQQTDTDTPCFLLYVYSDSDTNPTLFSGGSTVA